MSKHGKMWSALPEAEGEPAEQAARWLSYLYSGAATEEGLQAFSVWLRRSSANGDAYGELQQMWGDLASVEAHSTAAPQPLIARNPIHGRRGGVAARESAKPTRRGVAGWVAIAATLLVALLGGAFWQMQERDDVAVVDYRTGISEVKRVRLGDGSTVTMSASSSLHAEMSRTRRGVVLRGGRAFFDVVPQGGRPFTVDAGGARVSVVGTAFDVDRSSQDVRISVTKGVVMVGTGEARASSGVRLVAGQQLTASENGTIRTEGFDPRRAMPWLSGMLVYRNEPLGRVVAEVNRYRALKIIVADDRLVRAPITLAIRTDETDSLLAGLETMRIATTERTSHGVILRAVDADRAR